MLLQPVLLLALIVIVQTDFTNGNNTRRFCQCIQLVAVSPFLINGTGRVNAHSRENSTVAFGSKLQHLFTGLQTHTRLDRVGNISILQFLEQLLPVAFFEGISILSMAQIPEGFLVSIIVVMGMGIDDHEYTP